LNHPALRVKVPASQCGIVIYGQNKADGGYFIKMGAAGMSDNQLRSHY
jgi:hypothetical protein